MKQTEVLKLEIEFYKHKCNKLWERLVTTAARSRRKTLALRELNTVHQMAVSSIDNFAEKQKYYQRYIDELKTKVKSLEKVIQKYQDKETEAYARQAFPEDQVQTNPPKFSKGGV